MPRSLRHLNNMLHSQQKTFRRTSVRSTVWQEPMAQRQSVAQSDHEPGDFRIAGLFCHHLHCRIPIFPIRATPPGVQSRCN